MSPIDIVFVVSLSILSLSFIVFLVFFIPVLIQLAKTLEAAQTLVNIAKDYMVGINSKVNSLSQNLTKLASYMGEVTGTFADTLLNIVFPKKK